MGDITYEGAWRVTEEGQVYEVVAKNAEERIVARSNTSISQNNAELLGDNKEIKAEIESHTHSACEKAVEIQNRVS